MAVNSNFEKLIFFFITWPCALCNTGAKALTFLGHACLTVYTKRNMLALATPPTPLWSHWVAAVWQL